MRGPAPSSALRRPGVRSCSVEQLAAAGDELIATRPCAHQLDGNPDELPDALDVVAAFLWEVVPFSSATDVRLPAWHLFVDRFAVLVVRDVGDRMIESLAEIGR